MASGLDWSSWVERERDNGLNERENVQEIDAVSNHWIERQNQDSQIEVTSILVSRSLDSGQPPRVKYKDFPT